MDDCSLVVLTSPRRSAPCSHESPEFTLNLLNNLAVRLRTMDQTFVLELGRNALAAKTKMDQLDHAHRGEQDRQFGDRHRQAARPDPGGRDAEHRRGPRDAVPGGRADRTSSGRRSPRGTTWSRSGSRSGKGLAGYVAKTGETVNITDAYKDPRFNPEIDRKSGYKTQNVLCMPMRDKEGKIVGVFQFLNKRDGSVRPRKTSRSSTPSPCTPRSPLENARLAREMVQSERLSAVGRMASTIIHDIKNPMGTLRMYAQVIKRKTGDTESVAARRRDDPAGRPVRQHDAGNPRFLPRVSARSTSRRVELSDVMESLLAFIEKDLSKRNITLVHELRVRRAVRCIDVEKMVRVFYNLAGNAADAMTGRRDADHPRPGNRTAMLVVRVHRHRRRHPRGDPHRGLRAVLHLTARNTAPDSASRS